MIPLKLSEIADMTGGRVYGDPSVTVTAPPVLDGRTAVAGALFVAVVGEQADGHDYAEQAGSSGAVAALGGRATALPTVVVDDTQLALQVLASHVVDRLRHQHLSVLSVTGSQGKTSTKDLLRTILASTAPTIATAGSLNNELGVPLTMLQADLTTRALALEIGARRIGDIDRLARLAAPDVAVVLNVGQSHLGSFGSRAAIAHAKGELVRNLTPGGTAVLNADDPYVTAMRALTDGPVLTFGYAEHADVRVVDLRLDRLGRPSFTLLASGETASVSLSLVGAHQATNAAAAAAAALTTGISLDAAATALATAEVSQWRMELRRLDNGVLLINDSYNANPESTQAALDTLATIEAVRRIAVLGAMLELGDESNTKHLAIGRYAATQADIVLAVGDDAQGVAEGAGERAVSLPDNAAAVAWLGAHLAPGDVALIKASRGAKADEIATALA